MLTNNKYFCKLIYLYINTKFINNHYLSKKNIL